MCCAVAPASGAMTQQQNGGGHSAPAEQSRSGLLVAQQILSDKLDSSGEVGALFPVS